MIGTQRCLLKCIRKCGSRHVYRKISNMSIDDKKTKDPKCSETTDKPKKDVPCENTKKGELNDYSSFLPDRKGDVKVCIIGGGKVSLYAAVLIKQSRLIKRVHLVDTKNSLVSAVSDASHIDTSARLKYFKKKYVKQALKDANIIALMDETDPDMTITCPKAQFEAAALYAQTMADQMVQYCSESLVAVFARPVTAMLPMISEVYKLAGWWDPDRIIGSTSFDRMRMEAITANLLDLNPAFLSVPMIGGADPYTIVPILSRASPANQFTNAQQEMLLQYFRGADQEVANIESRQMIFSSAAAAARLILALAGGLSGCPNIITSAYVRSNVLPVCKFFTNELQFGTGGVQKNFGLPKMSAPEILMLEQAIPFINEYSTMAINTVYQNIHITRKSA
ncbi:malate dehydrogenase, mitochondrial [Calliopsis andreniformis]|uniref:malate dehydrogenase, mitochondrial n=1 Tax=Calliopsis andreniformis TaxID=337506 RepID=UPI003FCD484C